MRTIWVALSIVALLLVAMAPPASAQCNASNANLLGTYAFRLVPAKGFSADLANASDPGNVHTAPRQDILRVGVFTADGCGNISGGHTLATTDTNAGDTWLINFTWTGGYTLNSDLTGTLNITSATESLCTDMTLSPGGTIVPCIGNEETAETYSISVSATNGVQLAETDNLEGGGAKIFMTGKAIQQ